MALISFEDYQKSKSVNPAQNRMPDSHSGMEAAEVMQVIINHLKIYDHEENYFRYFNGLNCYIIFLLYDDDAGSYVRFNAGGNITMYIQMERSIRFVENK